MNKTNNPTFQQSIKLDYFILGITQADEIYATAIVQPDAESVCSGHLQYTQREELMELDSDVKIMSIKYD